MRWHLGFEGWVLFQQGIQGEWAMMGHTWEQVSSPISLKNREMRRESQKRRAWYGWVRIAFNWQRIVEGFLETAVKVIIASIYLFWMLFYGRCFHSHSFIYSGVTALWDRKQYSDFVCGEPGVESWKLFELLQRGSSRRRPDDMCLVIIPRGSHLR